MQQLKKKLLKRELSNCIYIVLGLLLGTCGYNLFFIPNNIAPGGFTGAAQVINSLSGWPIGVIVLCMNIPLYLLTFKSMGLAYGVRSIVTAVAFSFLLDWMKLPVAAEDTWLATIYGGILSGIGFGLILRGNANTGGTDMLANLIHKHLPSVSIGTIMSCFDGLVVVASAVVFDMTLALYALIAMIICNLVINFVLEGPNSAHAYFIISDRDKEISDIIMYRLGRGVTMWSGTGMYSGNERKVLLCAVSIRETVTLRRIIHSVDPTAFIISTRAYGTYGEGFKNLTF